ncbi:PREDICTED: uncharacterized protein LOC18610476 isoform X2 [Theobroma cacao]|uniref:Uncharacterized protein LOC18610476 isoform X2 n=1 Tax=Theobroma cacao TaxID=3641 RepID=A0AB32VKH7_THECC|nr:PREDICTED: uncharacterized protein LOC18610476 isoform X2 [Theobroma cacao]
MAMQTGVGLSKILILAGAGYTGTILLKNGKLSDIIGELQSLVRGLENSGEQSDDSDALLAQVRRLSTEIRQLASARQIHVLNGDSGGKLTSLVVPVATLGALSYGYMWWKGISFSDLFWVTKRSMAIAVENLTKNLDSVSDALSAAKKHLTQRIQNLDDKMETQKEISKSIQESVEEARSNLSNIEYDLDALQRMISGLDGKIGSLEYKQDLATAGVWYLCNVVGGKKTKMPEALQDQLKLSVKSRNLLTNSGTPTPKGLKDVADIFSGSANNSGTDAIVQEGIDNLDEEPRSLQREHFWRAMLLY